MWYPILHSIAEALRDDSSLDGVTIVEGSGLALKKYPCVEILRESDNGTTLHGSKSGSVTLYVQPWIRNDNPDPSVAYIELYNLELKVLACISSWAKNQDDSLGVAFKVTIEGLVGDGDQLRPMCGSRFIVRVDWRK